MVTKDIIQSYTSSLSTQTLPKLHQITGTPDISIRRYGRQKNVAPPNFNHSPIIVYVAVTAATNKMMPHQIPIIHPLLSPQLISSALFDHPCGNATPPANKRCWCNPNTGNCCPKLIAQTAITNPTMTAILPRVCWNQSTCHYFQYTCKWVVCTLQWSKRQRTKE